MVKKVKNWLIGKWQNSVFLLVLIFSLILGAVAYYGVSRSTTGALVEQILHREQLAARMGANSINSFISLSSRSLFALAENPIIVNLGPGTQPLIQDFINNWQGTALKGVIIVDKNGQLLYSANREGAIWGKTYLGDRDYFLKVGQVQKGQFVISSPIISREGATKGKSVIIMVMPLYQGGKFNGAIVVSILLTDFVKDYLEPLKVTNETSIILADSAGDIIGGSSSFWEQLVGVNLIELFQKYPFLGSNLILQQLKGTSNVGSEKKFDLVLPSLGKDGKPDFSNLERYVIAYTPFKVSNTMGANVVNDQLFYYIIAVPATTALAEFTPLYVKQILALIVVILIFFVFALRLAKIYAYREALKNLPRKV